MKTVKIAIWINVLLYAANFCFSGWWISKSVIVLGPRFLEIPNHIKLFLVFMVLVHGLLVLSIIGLLRRKNWGRILTICINIFSSIGYLSGCIIGAMGGTSIIQVLTAQKVLIALIVVIPLIALTIILFTRQAKSYFKAPKG